MVSVCRCVEGGRLPRPLGRIELRHSAASDRVGHSSYQAEVLQKLSLAVKVSTFDLRRCVLEMTHSTHQRLNRLLNSLDKLRGSC